MPFAQMTRDKYAHLRPRKQRQCFRADGVPKKRYTRTQARTTAAKFDGYHAYRCGDCGHWHVGTVNAVNKDGDP